MANKVILMGNLTRDPEVKHVPSGAAVVEFSVAVNEKVKKGEEWVDEATFVDCFCWGKRGEALARHHQKGDRILVEGKLKLETWKDRETGGNRSRMRVKVESWEFAK